jgi:hypothetical protein
LVRTNSGAHPAFDPFSYLLVARAGLKELQSSHRDLVFFLFLLFPALKRVLRNSCRPLKRTRFVPLLLSRHSRAGPSHAGTSWLESILSHRSGATSSFVADSERAGLFSGAHPGRSQGRLILVGAYVLFANLPLCKSS